MAAGGPNGAGKTTTVEIIEGLRTPDSGAVRVAASMSLPGRAT
ncbi:MAG: ATP-binding cassette domain-containing protein [Dehalococcoidia bacterium]